MKKGERPPGHWGTSTGGQVPGTQPGGEDTGKPLAGEDGPLIVLSEAQGFCSHCGMCGVGGLAVEGSY